SDCFAERRRLTATSSGSPRREPMQIRNDNFADRDRRMRFANNAERWAIKRRFPQTATSDEISFVSARLLHADDNPELPLAMSGETGGHHAAARLLMVIYPRPSSAPRDDK
ncbi:hypothetical protein, partial [Burkholderia oklahomensis]